MSTISNFDSPRGLDDDKITSNRADKQSSQKILEEDEYLDRMAKIIRRDFFSESKYSEDIESTPSSNRLSESSDRNNYHATPRSDRSQFSTSSAASKQASCSLKLNEFLEKYTSEDNAYFEELQRKELRRHRYKYPWLYKDKTGHNNTVKEQLRLPSMTEQAAIGCSNSPARMIDWPHNPKNTLFHALENSSPSKRPKSTVNYHSNQYYNKPIFKEPFLPREVSKSSAMGGMSDKIGIDGKSLKSNFENPNVNGYSFIPEPETPVQPDVPELGVTKFENNNRFYIPMESARDELAHRVYQDKVANVIRTPKVSFNNDTPSLRTPSSSRKSYASFSFSPERVKMYTPKVRRNK